MPRIFISYRRADSASITDRIDERLTIKFGRSQVFKDTQSIGAGEDFISVLRQGVANADVVLVVIGKTWLNIKDGVGNRRLDDDEDFVRIEIETALRLPNVRVIPVLVNGAVMPEKDKLPPTLHELHRRNALPIRNDPDFDRDIKNLIAEIRNGLSFYMSIKQWYLRLSFLTQMFVATVLFITAVASCIFTFIGLLPQDQKCDLLDNSFIEVCRDGGTQFPDVEVTDVPNTPTRSTPDEGEFDLASDIPSQFPTLTLEVTQFQDNSAEIGLFDGLIVFSVGESLYTINDGILSFLVDQGIYPDLYLDENDKLRFAFVRPGEGQDDSDTLHLGLYEYQGQDERFASVLQYLITLPEGYMLAPYPITPSPKNDVIDGEVVLYLFVTLLDPERNPYVYELGTDGSYEQVTHGHSPTYDEFETSGLLAVVQDDRIAIGSASEFGAGRTLYEFSAEDNICHSMSFGADGELFFVCNQEGTTPKLENLYIYWGNLCSVQAISWSGRDSDQTTMPQGSISMAGPQVVATDLLMFISDGWLHVGSYDVRECNDTNDTVQLIVARVELIENLPEGTLYFDVTLLPE